MANRCAGLDPTWAHRTAPAAGHCRSTSAWLFPAAAFENEALTSALCASMSPATNAAASSSSSDPTTPSSSSTSELLSSGGHDAPSPAAASSPGRPPLARQKAAGPKAGRVTKRKPRPSSRRPQPVTYFTAGPADFRRMVQQITGYFPPVGACSSVGVRHHQDTAAPTPAAPTPPACATLPTLDTSAFLLDHHSAVAARPAAARGLQPDDKSSTGGGGAMAEAVTAAAVECGVDDDSSVLHEVDVMATFAPPAFGSDFPTLESWGII